jgi:hypothetical protein
MGKPLFFGLLVALNGYQVADSSGRIGLFIQRFFA